MFGTDRTQLRRFYGQAWAKARQNQPLEPLEEAVAQVVGEHPEYQPLLEAGDATLDKDFSPEAGSVNPFLHMGMHLALREQLMTGRPEGLVPVFQSLSKRLGDAHEAEHRMMDCLGEALWRAQRNNAAPDERAYLECLKRLL